jgi:hypothetical protein
VDALGPCIRTLRMKGRAGHTFHPAPARPSATVGHSRAALPLVHVHAGVPPVPAGSGWAPSASRGSATPHSIPVGIGCWPSVFPLTSRAMRRPTSRRNRRLSCGSAAQTAAPCCSQNVPHESPRAWGGHGCPRSRVGLAWLCSCWFRCLPVFASVTELRNDGTIFRHKRLHEEN